MRTEERFCDKCAQKIHSDGTKLTIGIYDKNNSAFKEFDICKDCTKTFHIIPTETGFQWNIERTFAFIREFFWRKKCKQA